MRERERECETVSERESERAREREREVYGAIRSEVFKGLIAHQLEQVCVCERERARG